MAAAWALLRPSAIASAKLANSTVNHSHSVIARMKPAGASPCPNRAWKNSAVVRMLPTHTTNITGLLHLLARAQLPERVHHAPGVTMSRSNRENGLLWLSCQISLMTLSHVQMLDHGPSASAGTKVSAPPAAPCRSADDEQRRMRRHGARAGGHAFLGRQRTGQRQHRDHQPEAAEPTCATPSGVVERRVRAERPAKALPLLPTADEKAYSTSVKPCAPGLKMLALPAPSHAPPAPCRPAATAAGSGSPAKPS